MAYRKKPEFPLELPVDLEEVIALQAKADPMTAKAVLDGRGHEIPCPTPIEPPLGYNKQPSLMDQVRNAVRAERLALEAMEPETFEEHNDFDVEDDPQPQSKWENDTEPTIQELRRRAREAGYRFNPQSGEIEAIPQEAAGGPPNGPPEPSSGRGDPERSRAPKGAQRGGRSQAPVNPPPSDSEED